MPRKGASEEQIITAPQQGKAGAEVAEGCLANERQPGDVLHLAQVVSWLEPERVAGTAAATGGRQPPEAVGG